MADKKYGTDALAAAAITAAEIATDAVAAAEIAADAVTASEIATDAVAAAEILADAVGSSEIAADAVTASEIATDAVGSAEILADAVTAAEIATDAVAAAEIAADAVTASEIATDAVAAAEILADAVGSSEIAADAVTDSELAADSVGTSEMKSGVVPIIMDIPCINPSAVKMLGMQRAPAAFAATSVLVTLATVPTTAGDIFSFNVRNGTVGTMFAADQTYPRTPNVDGFLKTTDNEATFTSYLAEVTDAGAGVAVLSLLDTAANGDFFYVGHGQLFGGCRLDMTANVNVTVTTMTAKYWDGAAWQPVTITDGTAAAGAPLAQDGDVTWNIPGDWQQKTINASPMYWIRFQVAAALSAAVEVTEADVIRAPDVAYTYTPDQNLTVANSAQVRVNCTEADANAAGMTAVVVGTCNF